MISLRRKKNFDDLVILNFGKMREEIDRKIAGLTG